MWNNWIDYRIERVAFIYIDFHAIILITSLFIDFKNVASVSVHLHFSIIFFRANKMSQK